MKSGQHLLSLVEDLFDTTMIETGQVKINYEKTDIVSLLEEVKEIIHGESLSAKKNDIELILNLECVGNQRYLVTDIRKLKQVLLNLLRNALKFTDKGYIEFGFEEITDEYNNWFQFYVKDTGIGIEKRIRMLFFFYSDKLMIHMPENSGEQELVCQLQKRLLKYSVEEFG